MNKNVFRSNLFQLDFFNRYSVCITLPGATNTDVKLQFLPSKYQCDKPFANRLLTLFFFTKENNCVSIVGKINLYIHRYVTRFLLKQFNSLSSFSTD